MSSACAYCDSPLADDQEWCLECGAAQTLIHSAPDWRVAVAIVTTVVILALITLAIVLVNLSADVSRTAITVTATSNPSSTAAAAPGPATSAPPTFLGWPVGLSGWTVVLARSRSQTLADRSAAVFAADGVKVGVLDSNQHPTMPAGYWFVFTGRYPDRARARAAAARLRLEGKPSAVAVQVARPGGL